MVVITITELIYIKHFTYEYAQKHTVNNFIFNLKNEMKTVQNCVPRPVVLINFSDLGHLNNSTQSHACIADQIVVSTPPKKINIDESLAET